LKTGITTFVISALFGASSVFGETPVLAWKRDFSHPEDIFDSNKILAISRDGEIAVAAEAITGEIVSGTTTVLNFDLNITKYGTSTGRTRWQTFYDNGTTTADFPKGISFDQAGNVVVINNSYSAISMSSAMHIAKYGKADGNLVWSRLFDVEADPQSDIPSDLAVDQENCVVVAGNSGRSVGQDAIALRYSPSGVLLWEKRVTSQGAFMVANSRAYAVTVDRDNAVALVGDANKVAFTPYAPFVTKHRPSDGAVLLNVYVGDSNTTGALFDVVTDPQDAEIFVCGATSLLSDNLDPKNGFVARLDANTGEIIWRVLLEGTNNGFDALQFIRLGPEGHPIVAGSFSNGADSDFYVAKLSRKNGKILWKRRIPGKPGRGDTLRGLAMDRAGNPVVTGVLGESATVNSVRTLKLSAATGATLWDTKLRPGASAVVYDLGIDRKGNVFVCGAFSRGVNALGDDQTNAFLAKYRMNP